MQTTLEAFLSEAMVVNPLLNVRLMLRPVFGWLKVYRAYETF